MANDFGIAGDGGGGLESILELLSQGGSSPLLRTILAPLLKIQARDFPIQERNLTDSFRRAGALRDTSFGNALSRLSGDQALARSSLIGSTASSFLSPLLQLLMRQSTNSLTPSAAAGLPPSLGLATPTSITPTTTTPTPTTTPLPQALDLDALINALLGGSGGGIDYSQLGGGLGPQTRSFGNPEDFITNGPFTDVS